MFQLGRAHDRRREADAFDEGLDVLLPFGRAAFLEVAEVDVGAAERVGVFQPDFAFVVRIGLEDDPAEAIVSLAPRSVRRLLALEVARVTLFIAPEVARQAENEQVGDAVLCLGVVMTIIKRSTQAENGIPDLVALGRRVVSAERALLARGAERGAFEQREGLFQFRNQRDLAAVLEVLANARQVPVDRVDLHLLEVIGGPDAGQHQQLRGVERAAAQDDLTARADADLFLLRPRRPGHGGRSGRGLVDPLLFPVTDPDRPFVVVPALDNHLCDQRAGNQVQALRVALLDPEDALADAGPYAVEDRGRRVVSAGPVLVLGEPAVRVQLGQRQAEQVEELRTFDVQLDKARDRARLRVFGVPYLAQNRRHVGL